MSRSFLLQPESEDGSKTLVRSEMVDGGFALRDMVVAPGREIPAHRHGREDELWYVLDGEVTFRLGDDVVRANKGAVVVARQGDVHAFANRSTKPARMLELFVPGGMERYFDERANLATRSPGRDYAGLEPAEHKVLAARFHMEFVE